MAPTAAANRPAPVHSLPNGGNPPFRPSSGLPNSGQLDPGLPGPSHDTGLSSHPHPQHTRPVFYVPAPPPPPFLQCQWPMPVSYNPFSVFPGMGYGMVMPPFPPPLPPYMDPPTCFLPPAHIQPMEYRRMPHPQVHAPNPPYQIPNQTRRIRVPHSAPVRETVSSAVQTEPTERGLGCYNDRYLTVRSDSGHETVSNSPSPSSSRSHERGSAEVENYTLHSGKAKSVQGNKLCTHEPVVHPTEPKAAQTCFQASVEKKGYHKDGAGQEEVLPCGNERHTMCSVASLDSVGPMCSSSQQEDEGVREGVSVPDILSWGAGGSMPQEAAQEMPDDVQPQSNNHQLSDIPEVEQEKSDDHSPAKPQDDPPTMNPDSILSTIDSEALFKILQLPSAPYELHSEPRQEAEPRDCDGEQESISTTILHDESTRSMHYQISSSSGILREKFNESVWSVESLVPFVPTKEWMWQRGITEPGVIVSKPENDRPPTTNLKSGKSRKQSRRFTFPETVSCDSWLSFSTPYRHTGNEMDCSENGGPKHGQSGSFDPSLSPFEVSRKMFQSTSSEKDVVTQMPAEPQAHQSPNQESLITNDQQKETCHSPEQETATSNHDEEKEILSTGHHLQNGGDGNQQLCVPGAEERLSALSPSKGHAVDCGVQCTDLQPCCKHCKELESSVGQSKGMPLKITGVMGMHVLPCLLKLIHMNEASSGQAHGPCMNAIKPTGHANGKEKKRRAASWPHLMVNA